MKTGFLIIATLFCAGCDILALTCTSELRANLIVQVRDRVSGEPAALGVTGTAQHQDGAITELSAFDSLLVGGNWQQERAGRYSIELRKPGYLLTTANTEVDDNRCHIETRTLRTTITSDPAAVAIIPSDFQLGELSNVSVSAGVQVFGNTLQIVGAAPAACTELRVVSFRSHDELHVQLEPSGQVLDTCDVFRNQQFMLRYDLPAGNTYLMMTAGWGIPAVLYSGMVRPG